MLSKLYVLPVQENYNKAKGISILLQAIIQDQVPSSFVKCGFNMTKRTCRITGLTPMA